MIVAGVLRRGLSSRPASGLFATRAILSRTFGSDAGRGGNIAADKSATTSAAAERRPHQITEEEAQSRAQQILQYFPGSTMVRKAAYATITGGLVSFLVANGIYIPNDETLILVAFALVVRVLYVKLSPLLTDLIDSGINELRTRLSTSRVKEVDSVNLEITELEQLRDFAAITAEIFETKRENVVLEAQLGELVERQRFLQGVKGQLDEAVRRATEKREAERRAFVESVMAGVMTALKEPKLQERILQKCISDLRSIPVQPKALQ